MTKYRHKETGRVLTILSEVDGNLTVKFDDGTEQVIRFGTLKRWYKKFEEDAQTVKKAEKRTKTATSKPKKENKKPETPVKHDADETTVANQTVTLITSYIIAGAEKLGAEIFIPAKEGMKMRAFKVCGRVFAKIFYTKNSVSMFVRSKSVSLTPDKIINYNLDGQFIFTAGCDLNLIDSLLSQSYSWVNAKQSNKPKKTIKEEN